MKDNKPIKILLYAGTATLENVGDVAMLEVGISRIRQPFPNAELTLFSKNREAVQQILGKDIQTISPNTRNLFFKNSKLLPIYNRLPSRIREFLKPILQKYRYSYFDHFYRRLLGRVTSKQREELNQFVNTVQKADILVFTGMGSIHYRSASGFNIFNLVGWCLSLKKKVVMMGQGIGPIKKGSRLDKLAQKYLPKVNLIGVREKFSYENVQAYGLDETKICLTGDDALALSHYDTVTPDRTENQLFRIGLNLRTNHQTAFLFEETQSVISSVNAVALDRKYQILPLILNPDSSGDQKLVFDDYLFDQCQELFDEKVLLDYTDQRKISLPKETIRKIKGTDLVITFAFHTAVFAIASGVPVICVYKTDYYYQKFMGLLSFFDIPELILEFDADNFRAHLEEKMNYIAQNRAALIEKMLVKRRNVNQYTTAFYTKFFESLTLKTA